MPTRAGQFIFSFMLFAFLSSESASEIQSVGPDDEVILSLHQADIQDLVRWASAVTEKTIIIHPAVSGRVTVIAGDPMSRDVAYQTFLSVLKIHGFAVIQSGQSLKVVPEKQANTSDLPLLDNLDPDLLSDDMVVRIFNLDNIPVAETVNLIRPLMPSSAYIAAYPGTNVLLMASRAAKINQIAKIIEKIDQRQGADVKLIPLEFANASQVSQLLVSLIATGQHGQGNRFNVSVDDRSNSILMTCHASLCDQAIRLVDRLDQPLSGGGNTQVIFLQYARAEDLVPILESVSGSEQKVNKDEELNQADVSIRADESLNSLIISAPPSILSTLKGVIAKLDVRRAQVLVEALIVEVNEDFSRDIGIQWQNDLNLKNDAEHVFGGVSAFPNAVGAFSVDKDGGVSLGRGLSLGYFRGKDLRAILRALEGESDANVLSTPTILAMDNEEASILVGSNVPFVTGSQNRAGDRNLFQTIKRQDIGVSLKIKPHINNSDSLTLEIEQTVESIAQTDASTADIITNKREISTRVLIDNDQILVLGGLIKDQVVESERRVPLLGSIPLLGRAFKSTSSKVIKQNLMVFIYPVILRDSRAGYQATRDRYQYMQGRQSRFRKRVDNFFVPGDPALLPDLEAQEAQEAEQMTGDDEKDRES